MCLDHVYYKARQRENKIPFKESYKGEINMSRKALTDKMIVLGVDGMDPSLAKHCMDKGLMPNLKKFVEKGSAREDMVLLGAVPTVTPPMWTTLASGAYPKTHGVTAFFKQHPEKLDTTVYNLDSRLTTAEMLWNVFAEAGKKTLVWHWPGSSWPPTSDSPNLHVVDGTQPAGINMGVANIDWEKLGMASTEVPELIFRAFDSKQDRGVAGCVITGLEDAVADENAGETDGADVLKMVMGGPEQTFLVMDESENEISLLGNVTVDVINSPIKPAKGWEYTPEDAKEFTILTSAGLVRRPCLLLKNEDGIYDRVALFKSKKDSQPLFIAKQDELVNNYVDEVLVEEEKKIANRLVKFLEIAPDGSKVRFWMSAAYDMSNDSVWHPKSLLKKIEDNVGPVPPVTTISGKVFEHADKIETKVWDNYCQWQADALTYLMDNDNYDIIFSHLHNVDAIGHQIWHYAKHRDEWGNDEKAYQSLLEYVYKQTDDYLGNFVKYLDEGWTVIITSDHGLISEENEPPVMVEGTVSIPVMKELGYTVLKKDENGKELREIDWSKTRAVAVRGGHIYLNLKGRQAEGIVDPAEQYELEAQIISDLYNYRDPRTGKRVVSIALRNRDAVILGLGGPECGDIYFFMEEDFNIIHMDSLPTQRGYFDTSVSPIFVAAGPGIKEGYTIKRDIRQVDVAPTMAALGGVRMPAQNEGSVIHQILTEEF